MLQKSLVNLTPELDLSTHQHHWQVELWQRGGDLEVWNLQHEEFPIQTRQRLRSQKPGPVPEVWRAELGWKLMSHCIILLVDTNSMIKKWVLLTVVCITYNIISAIHLTIPAQWGQIDFFYACALNILKSTFSGFNITVLMKKVKKSCFYIL